MDQRPLLCALVAWFPHQGGHASLLKKKIVQQGGRVEDSLTPAVTHIVCEPQVQRAKLEAVLPQGRALASFQLVRMDFICESIRLRALQDPAAFRPFLMGAAAGPPLPPAAAAGPGPYASTPPPKSQNVEPVPTPPPRPSGAPILKTAAPGGPGPMETEETDVSQDQEQQEEEEPCVVARRGAEWVAVHGRLPRFTGGATGLPWGSYGVWTEPYDHVAAAQTAQALQDLWNGKNKRKSASADGAAPAMAPAPAAPPTNGVCPHVACSLMCICIVQKLEGVRAAYSPTDPKLPFRVRKAQQAEWAVAKWRRPLREPEDVEEMARMRRLGTRTARKVREILEVGRFASRVDGLGDNGHLVALAALQRVWGAGATVAQAWYEHGCRDVGDVRRAAAAGGLRLTAMQRCGVAHFEDLQRKVPRVAVAAVEGVVRRAVFEEVERKLGAPDAERAYCAAAGSYARGATESGDVDMLVVLPPSAAGVHCGDFLRRLLGTLCDGGLLLDEMDPREATRAQGDAHYEEHAGHACWQGVCRPPGAAAGARIDVRAYGPQHLAFAVNYFTSGREFCRAMRHWANRAPAPVAAAKALAPGAIGFKLSDQGMVPRQRRRGWGKNARGEDVLLGPPVAVASESELFEHLDLAYCPPFLRSFHA